MVDRLTSATLRHHLRRAERGEITNVLRDCHVKGLWSVMLHDEPGNRVRMFYADPDHELWKNNYPSERMSLAIHRHHCDVTLVHVFGPVANLLYSEPIPAHGGPFFACTFESGITGERASLTPLGSRFQLQMLDARYLRRGIAEMLAKNLHTVALEQDRSAAWLVLEGAEDESYSSVCYTTNPSFDAEQLYRREPEFAANIIAAALQGMADE